MSGASASGAGVPGSSVAVALGGLGGSLEDKDCDLLCPVCFELIEEAYVTRCGHSFCYACVAKAVELHRRCPKCGAALASREHIFPNFLLNELVAKRRLRTGSRGAGAGGAGGAGSADAEGARLRALVAAEARHLALPDVERLLEVLARRRRALRADSSAAHHRLLLAFLRHLHAHKRHQLDQLSRECALVRRDMEHVSGVLSALRASGAGAGGGGDTPTPEGGPDDAGSELQDAMQIGGSLGALSGTPGAAGGEEESFAGGGGDALAARWRKLTAHFDDFVQCYFAHRADELYFPGSSPATPAPPAPAPPPPTSLTPAPILPVTLPSVSSAPLPPGVEGPGNETPNDDHVPNNDLSTIDISPPPAPAPPPPTSLTPAPILPMTLPSVSSAPLPPGVEGPGNETPNDDHVPNNDLSTIHISPPPPTSLTPAPILPVTLPSVSTAPLPPGVEGPGNETPNDDHVPNNDLSTTSSERRLPGENEVNAEGGEGSGVRGLELFREDLVAFTKYRALRPLATLSYCSDAINYSTIVSTIEFDKDEEFFAIAGVTKRIKVFEYEAVVRDAVDVHYPCAEMQCSHKVSCVSWNAYHKNVLASADYEGCVCVWDAATGQRTRALQEHDKRAWSVHFNRADVRLLASGSDDARVKLWALNAERSVATLEAKFNVCCVRFNPRSSCHLAFGSADHCVHYYDLRAPRHPLQVFRDHRKAVSYVQFLNAHSLVSASTDSQLKLWRVDSPRCVRSFSGHANEKNFVGLATDGSYLACGSENNALYVYYSGLSRPLLAYRFEAVRGFLEKERRDEEPADFVSAVCWRRERADRALLAANSQGCIKVLQLV